MSSGYLTSEQREHIQKLRDTDEKYLKPDKLVEVAVGTQAISRWGDFFKENPAFKPLIVEKHPLELPINHRPDIFSGVNDVSFNQSLSVIAYNVKQGIFGLYDKMADQWLSEFMHSGQAEQVKMLNALHYKSLENCNLYPISSSPYIVIARNGWKASLSPFFSSTELWLIKKN